MTLVKKLARYQPYFSQEKEKENREEKKDSLLTEIPYLEEWQAAGCHPYFSDNHYCLIREKRFPIKEKRGTYRFEDFFRAIEAWQKTSLHHPLSAKGYKGTQLFFFDIETTGLGSGVGNTIFLLGYAFFTENEVIVRQHFLPEPAGEIPLYESFLKNVDYTTLVTYNGKAFDWPQVKTRHALIREHLPKLPSFGHFDLYHAARRLWKHRLASVKLSHVEKEILGIERNDDVPGHLAPMIYFDFLERKKPDGILKVLEHNEADILSLIILYTHISFQLLNLDQNQTNDEKLAVGHWYAYLNETEQAIHLLESALENNDNVERIFELSMQYKKLDQYPKAVELWLQLAEKDKGKYKYLAAIEAAKYFEHKEKDYVYAHHLAIKTYYEMMNSDSIEKKWLEDLENRIIRLERKILKSSE